MVPFRDYISKLILLEKAVGSITKYGILEPFALNAYDCLDIQKAAKRIASFVGLGEFVFIVGIAKQGENIGGHIELQKEGAEVFIEISDKLLDYPEAVLATLAHEITHKYLHVHQISCDEVYKQENEVLTDIAAVFLGLGKLMLNGCECDLVYEKEEKGVVETYRETVKSGYLSFNQLAFVYCLVCAMRRIPSDAYLKALLPKATLATRNAESRYGRFFRNEFRNPQIIEETIQKLRNEMLSIQRQIADIEGFSLYLEEMIHNPIDKFLSKTQRRILEIRRTLYEYLSEETYDPAHKFLLYVNCEFDAEYIPSELRKLQNLTERYQECISSIGNAVQDYAADFPAPSPEIFSIVVCRIDGTRVRVPKQKGRLRVLCPICKFEFIVNTEIPSLEKTDATPNSDEAKMEAREGILSRIFKRLRFAQ